MINITPYTEKLEILKSWLDAKIEKDCEDVLFGIYCRSLGFDYVVLPYLTFDEYFEDLRNDVRWLDINLN